MRLSTLTATAAVAVVMTATLASAQSTNTPLLENPNFGPNKVGNKCFRGGGGDGRGYWVDCEASGRTAQASGAPKKRKATRK
jgi:hypothetical protein